MTARPRRRTASTQRTQTGLRCHLSGACAEDIVERHYASSGRPVAHRRWRGTAGEIDLVAQDGDQFIFIEVKSARNFDRAAERLTPRQIGRICDTASEYLGSTPLGQTVRCEVRCGFGGWNRAPRNPGKRIRRLIPHRSAPCLAPGACAGSSGRNRSPRERDMSLNVAFQMDPIQAVDIAADSTFRLAEEAQARGHRLYVYTPDKLVWNTGRVRARARRSRFNGCRRIMRIWAQSRTWICRKWTLSGCDRIRRLTWDISPQPTFWSG